MKKKIEVKEVSDIQKLKETERPKWEVAVELGLFDRVVENGWKSLTSRESGRIGGILSARAEKAREKAKAGKTTPGEKPVDKEGTYVIPFK